MTINQTSVHTTLRAEGFSCPSCVSKIEKRVGRIPGVESVKVQFASARIQVEHTDEVTAAELIEAVAKAGYTATVAAF